MSRTTAAKHRRVCLSKRHYITKPAVKKAALTAKARGVSLEPYRCRTCKDWHLTTRRPKGARR